MIGRRALPSVGSLLSFWLAISGLAACGSDSDPPPFVDVNDPPIVERIYTVPARAHAAERVILRADVDDPDSDPIAFIWNASRGEFPKGVISAAPIWATAGTRGVDTVEVMIDDGKHQVVARAAIELVLPLPPSALSSVNFARLSDVSWRASPDEGMDLWRGYEVFAADRSLVGLSEAEVIPLRVSVDPVGASRIFRVRRLAGGAELQIGRRYYVHVRSLRVLPNGDERSLMGEEIVFAPRPDWTTSQFNELQSGRGAAALDLSTGSVRLLRAEDAAGLSERDIYFGTSDPDDGPGVAVVKSISRLSNRNPAWAGRVLQMKHLGRDWTVSTATDGGWAEELPVVVGDVLALRTPEGNWVKLRVTGLTGVHPNRALSVQWAYQTIPGFANF